MIFGNTASATLVGASATGLSVNLAPTYSTTGETVEDYLHNEYLIDDDTTDLALDLGSLVTCTHLLAVSDGPLTIKITQGGTDRAINLDGAISLDGTFTGLKVTNSDSSAHNLMVLVVGDR